MSASSLVFPGPDGHLKYVPDAQGNVIPDFSNVGYESGIVPLPGTNGTPDVPVKVIVRPLAKGVDAGATIQAAIDQVSKLPIDANGFRGAVLLKAGLYPIKGQIRITTSGVVLRGEGTDVPDTSPTGTVKVPGTGLTGTVLEATGTDRRYDPHLPFGDGLVQLEGAVPGGPKGTDPYAWNGGDDFRQFFAVAGTTHNITDDYVPVGAHSFHVDSVAGLQVGDSVIVHRPSTAAWIHAIGMDGTTDPWKPGQEDLDSDRVITAIDPIHNLITIDAPLTDALEKQFGGGTIFKYSFPGRIDHVGVENLSGFSDFDPSVTDFDPRFPSRTVHQVDENHAWTFISLAGVENAFVRQITAQHFAFGAVDVQKMSKWVTVADSQGLDPVSLIAGGRRDSFELGGQLTLVENCHSEHGRHDFILHSALPGPNVFLDCVARESFDESGPICTGTLASSMTMSRIRARRKKAIPLAAAWRHGIGAWWTDRSRAGPALMWSFGIARRTKWTWSSRRRPRTGPSDAQPSSPRPVTRSSNRSTIRSIRKACITPSWKTGSRASMACPAWCASRRSLCWVRPTPCPSRSRTPAA
jgi:hypothetical protein